MTTTPVEKPHCGETCPLLDFMVHVNLDRMTDEERLAAAIKAVTGDADGVERMSQRAAAKQFGVAQSTISDRLVKVTGSGHTPTPPAPQGKSKSAPSAESAPPPRENAKARSERIRKALLQLVPDHSGIPTELQEASKRVGTKIIRAWLFHLGVEIPPELEGACADIGDYLDTLRATGAPNSAKTCTPRGNAVVSDKSEGHTPSAPSTPQPTPSSNGPLATEASDPEPLITPDGTEHLNAEDLRDHCATKVAESDRPDDYKRAIQLLAELDHIITAAWRRQHPEPWIAGDWSHVSGELQALHSIANQRAVELSEAIVQRYTAVTVASSRVA